MPLNTTEVLLPSQKPSTTFGKSPFSSGKCGVCQVDIVFCTN